MTLNITMLWRIIVELRKKWGAQRAQFMANTNFNVINMYRGKGKPYSLHHEALGKLKKKSSIRMIVIPV